jgi:uncharacterized membrane protein YfcA
MMNKNYPVLLRIMLAAGAVCTSVSLLVHDHTTKAIFLILGGVFYISAVIQMILFKKKPQLFDDKKAPQ